MKGDDVVVEVILIKITRWIYIEIPLYKRGRLRIPTSEKKFWRDKHRLCRVCIVVFRNYNSFHHI